VQAQVISIDDLLTFSSLSSKNLNNFLNKRNFVPVKNYTQYNDRSISYYQNKNRKDSDSIFRKLDIITGKEEQSFLLNTSSRAEFNENCAKLKKAGFMISCLPGNENHDDQFFQKKNFTVTTGTTIEEDILYYRIFLQKKELLTADQVQYSEDLLKFDSHEYLASFFGEQNVKKDLYYFSEKELRKCSVLFPNTSRQALFIWNDQDKYMDLSYILISGVLPTVSAVQYSNFISQSKWFSKEGLYAGMSLYEVLQLNNEDFTFYGRNSEVSFMVDPNSRGNIDFKKTGIMLGCVNSEVYRLLGKEKISALEAFNRHIPLYVYYIMVSK
jgi:hypothetical protein